jgi:hypothetical protein
MPKFEAVLVFKRYQYVTLQAMNREQAMTNAIKLFDFDKPSNGLDCFYEVDELTQVAPKKRVKKNTNPMRPKEKGFTQIKLHILPLEK